MKILISGFLFFLLGLAWVPGAHAEDSDYQAALKNYDQGNYSQAVAGFENVIQKDPNSWKAYQGLGSAFLREGDKDGALQAYQRSLQLHPDNPAIQAMADKLSAEAKPASPTASPETGETPAATPDPFRVQTIGTFTDQEGHKDSSNYTYGGKPLESDDQIAEVINRIKDDQATRLIQNAKSQQNAANALDVLGGVCVGFAVGYGIAAPGTPVTNPSPFGGYTTSTGTPDLTPSYIVGGIGAVMLLIGLPVEAAANQDRYKAVSRYNEVVRSNPNPEASGPGTAQGAPVTGGYVAETTSSTPPPENSSGAPADSGESPAGLGISPVMNLPLSSKTGSEYNPGFGIALDFKRPLDSHWSVGLAATYQDLPVNKAFLAKSFQQTYGVAFPAGVAFSGDWYYFPVVALVQYSLPLENSQVVPYFFGGAGIAFNSATVSASYNNQTVMASTNEDDFLLCPGVGLRAQLDAKVDFFLQARVDINFTSQNNSDIITLTGPGGSTEANGNLSDDGPTLFLPVQAGLNF